VLDRADRERDGRGVNLLIGAVTIGLILSLLALGVFLTYRIFGLLDVTTDGSFGVGAATAAALLAHGWPPAAATAIGAWAGAMAGLVTGLVHTRFGVNALLAGILTTTALYSGNLYIMGGGDRSMAGVPTLFSRAEEVLAWLAPGTETLNLFGTPVVPRSVAALGLMMLIVPVVAWMLAMFFHTGLGLALRATGDNPQMARALGVSVSGAIVVGLITAIGLIGLSGALFAEYQGFANIQMGLGMIVTGLASVIVGETLFGRRGIASRIGAVIVGTVLFRLLIAGAVRAGVDPNALKLLTAVFVFLALVLPDALRRRLRRTAAPEAAGG
jgi:putative tryptophan/tyrosine transport system permease protein